MSEIIYLSADNVDDVLGEFILPYPFADIPGKPSAGFHCKSAHIGRIKKWQDAAKTDNSSAVFTATCELIADGVCDQAGRSVWNTSQIKMIAKANSLRFSDLVRGVLHHNGLSERSQRADIEVLVEDEEKN
jgi:hypothetical protein